MFIVIRWGQLLSFFPFLLRDGSVFFLIFFFTPCSIDQGMNGYAAQNSHSGSTDTVNTTDNGIELTSSFYISIMIMSYWKKFHVFYSHVRKAMF